MFFVIISKPQNSFAVYQRRPDFECPDDSLDYDLIEEEVLNTLKRVYQRWPNNKRLSLKVSSVVFLAKKTKLSCNSMMKCKPAFWQYTKQEVTPQCFKTCLTS